MTMTAAPRSLRQAQDIAMKHASSVGIRTSRIAAVALESAKTSANVSDKISSTALEKAAASVSEGCFIFNHGDNEGFTIVGADDRLPEIVGYSDAGSFDPTNIPDGLQFYLDLYAAEVKALDGEEGSAVLQRANSIKRVTGSTVALSPMVTTQWNQTYPYNNACPLYDGTNRSAVGCTAVAIGQIIRYHAPQAEITSNIPQYWTETYEIAIPAIKVAERQYNWSNMPNSLSGATDTQVNEVATFLYHVGAAFEMDYKASSGAGFDNLDSKLKYFNMTYSNDYFLTSIGTSLFITNVDKSLDDGYPCCVSGYTSGGSGHSFVCDGRNNSGYYHINWGWGGNHDGYFDITVLNATSTQTFNQSIQVITGIRPIVENAKTGLEELQDAYNAYGSKVIRGGTTGGFYDTTAANAFSVAVSKAQAGLNASASYTDAQLRALATTLTDAYNTAVNSRIPYANGVYRFQSVYSGASAMYDNGSIACWKTLDESDPAFKWVMEYDENSKSYKIFNYSTKNRLGAFYASTNISTGASYDVTTSSIVFDPQAFNIPKNCYREAICHYGSTDANGYMMLASNNFSSVVGGAKTEVASQWYPVFVEEYVDPEAGAIKDAVNELVENAQTLHDEDMAKLPETEELIKNADQLYSEFTETKEGGYAELLDNDQSTFWHSAWSGGNATLGTHYLQVELLEPQEGELMMLMARRTTADNDHITEFLLKVSNDANGPWTEACTISLPFSSVNDILSPTFELPGKYKYLRFYITNTYMVASTGLSSRGYGHMAEFQLYKCPDTKKLDALQSAISSVQAVTSPSAADLKTLKQALQDYLGKGNVNGDSTVDISDMVSEIEILNGRAKDIYGTGDVDVDLDNDLEDLDALAKIILN